MTAPLQIARQVSLETLPNEVHLRLRFGVGMGLHDMPARSTHDSPSMNLRPDRAISVGARMRSSPNRAAAVSLNSCVRCKSLISMASQISSSTPDRETGGTPMKRVTADLSSTLNGYRVHDMNVSGRLVADLTVRRRLQEKIHRLEFAQRGAPWGRAGLQAGIEHDEGWSGIARCRSSCPGI
jgi:hypothetical protein